MEENTDFLTKDVIRIICLKTQRFQNFKFIGLDTGDISFRRYECQCGCGQNRLFPVSLPNSRFENNGYGLIELTNKIALGVEDE